MNYGLKKGFHSFPWQGVYVELVLGQKPYLLYNSWYINSSMKQVALLVHGIFDKGKIFESLAEYLLQFGIESIYPDIKPNDGSESLDVLARQVSRHVEAIREQECRLYLVGYSMGGLICRYYMQALGGMHKIDRWVTISSPHHGTLTASIFWGKGVKQMRVGSTFLERLNKSVDSLKNVPLLSLWTPYDLMIVPAHSSRLPIGENIAVDCLAHPLMYTNKFVLKRIGDFLQERSEN